MATINKLVLLPMILLHPGLLTCLVLSHLYASMQMKTIRSFSVYLKVQLQLGLNAV